MEQPLINRVASSGLITINLEEFYPEYPIRTFDLKDYLFQGLILREKEFRSSLNEIDWASFEGSHFVMYCSTDAIIPTWAYMLVASKVEEYARSVYLGTESEFLTAHYQDVLSSLDYSKYENQRIVRKGCSKKPVPSGAYAVLTYYLKPRALSIMYGEPCSTVPIYKRPKIK
jgi:hypothetical protein